MLLLFRTAYLALLLIFTQLLAAGFEAGGKYQILFEAVLAALLMKILRRVLRERFALRVLGLICGVGALAGLFIASQLFAGVKFTVTGILLIYLGAVFMELLLPDQLQYVLKKDGS